ncbi:MAG: hypothetical protein ACE5GK_10265 [Nitrospiria bacterium]
MPNTLAHMGIQALATQAVYKKADLKWVYLGAVIPDLPWILQRLIPFVWKDIDRLDLRLYAIVQASLFFCLILCAGFALYSSRPKNTFFILAYGALIHLLLDALQIKWANGVHLLAPFNWRLLNFALFWPESLPTYLITAFGLLYALLFWKRSAGAPFLLAIRTAKESAVGILFVLTYLLLPLALLDGPEASDNHFVLTLRSIDDRPGKVIEIDRADYEHHPKGGSLHLFNGERFKVDGFDPGRSGLFSIKGFFSQQDRIQVRESHRHRFFRDAASYMGLGFIALLWTCSGLRAWRRLKTK